MMKNCAIGGEGGHEAFRKVVGHQTRVGVIRKRTGPPSSTRASLGSLAEARDGDP